MKILTSPYIVLLCISIHLVSCSKDFLEAKPDKDIVVPVTVKDIQAILDNDNTFNRNPGATFLANDDYYTIESAWNGYNPWEQRIYIWAEKPFEMIDPTSFDWTFSYRAIFQCNVALEQISNFVQADSLEGRRLRGTALFLRAYNYFGLAEVFMPTFAERNSDTKGYLPLRLSPNINLKVPFATINQIYELIIDDLEEAISLLPVTVDFKTRPSKMAAHSMLSRLYLAAEEYDLAHYHADIVYKSGEYKLLDYNNLNYSNSYPIPSLSEELILHSELAHVGFNGRAQSMIDSNLYRSYDNNDLRKRAFFRPQAGGWPSFQGSYTGRFRYFGGLALDEIYLTLAECKARKGAIPAAMDILNELVSKRWITGSFVPLIANNDDEALNQILDQRRKELVFRGTRWNDLRRLNKDPRFARTLTRIMAGNTYTLEPNSPRYVLPTPPRELELEN